MLSTVLYINVCARVLEFDEKRSNLLPYFFISSYLPKNMDYIWIILVPIILFQLVGPRSPKSMLIICGLIGIPSDVLYTRL